MVMNEFLFCVINISSNFGWNVIGETMHNVVRLCRFLEVLYCAVEMWGLYVGCCCSALYINRPQVRPDYKQCCWLLCVVHCGVNLL